MLLGFGTWEAASSLITGVIAKEIVVSFGGAAKTAVSTLLYLPQAEEPEEDQSPLKAANKSQFTPLSSFAFMAYVLLYVPCMIVLAAMREEFGTWKWVGVGFVYQTVLAWVVAFIIYQGGMLLGLGG